MRTTYRNCVVGIIISKDEKILMGMKDPKGGGVYADCWHLPGGGIEAGETQSAALRREILEEVGIDITDADATLIDDTGTGESQKRIKETGETVLCKMKFYVYKIKLSKEADGVTVTPGDDMQKTAWFSIDALLNLKLTPPSRHFFDSKMGRVTHQPQ